MIPLFYFYPRPPRQKPPFPLLDTTASASRHLHEQRQRPQCIASRPPPPILSDLTLTRALTHLYLFDPRFYHARVYPTKALYA